MALLCRLVKGWVGLSKCKVSVVRNVKTTLSKAMGCPCLEFNHKPRTVLSNEKCMCSTYYVRLQHPVRHSLPTCQLANQRACSLLAVDRVGERARGGGSHQKRGDGDTQIRRVLTVLTISLCFFLIGGPCLSTWGCAVFNI